MSPTQPMPAAYWDEVKRLWAQVNDADGQLAHHLMGQIQRGEYAPPPYIADVLADRASAMAQLDALRAQRDPIATSENQTQETAK